MESALATQSPLMVTDRSLYLAHSKKGHGASIFRHSDLLPIIGQKLIAQITLEQLYE